MSETFTVKECLVDNSWRVEVWHVLDGDLVAIHKDLSSAPTFDERKTAIEWCAGQLARYRTVKYGVDLPSEITFETIPLVTPGERYELTGLTGL